MQAQEKPATALFVMPWSPDRPAGVSVVVRNVAREFVATGRRAMFGIDDWTARRTVRQGPAVLRHRFGVLGGTGPLAVLKSAVAAPAALLATWRLLRAENVQAVNFHYPGLNALGVALLKRMGLYRGTLVLSFHGSDVRPPHGRVDALARRIIFAACDGISACAPALAARVAATYRIAPERVSVVFNGVDMRVFHPQAVSPQTVSLPLRYLVSVGGYIEPKGQRLLVTAFARLAPRFADVSLILIGMDGPERGPLQKLAQRLGIGHRLMCLADLPPAHVAGIVAGALGCVQPSRTESFPLSVLEAGACGVPILASRIPGHTDMLEEGVTARLFEVDDEPDCAAGMHTMLADLPAAARLAARFHAEVSARYTWRSTAKGYAALCCPHDEDAGRTVPMGL